MNAETLIGTRLGNSSLQRLVGHGTMGAVYLAQQSRPQRQVAVKLFLQAAALDTADHATFLERFRREVDAAGALEHPHILAIHEYGEHEGLAYLVTPYVPGGTLQDVLQRDGALPFPKVVYYLEQLAAALDLAHDRGVFHRDLKPGNLLLATDDRLRIADFCLSAVYSGKISRARHVVPNMLDYMSPELVLDQPIDRRADLYSLGAILYHMLTGSPPFTDETLTGVAMKHVQTPPPSPRSPRPDLPPAAEQVVLRALAKRPADRYARAQDLVAALRLAFNASGILLENISGMAGGSTGAMARLYTPRGLFDPQWQTGALPAIPSSATTPGAPPLAAPSNSITDQPAPATPAASAVPPAATTPPAQPRSPVPTTAPETHSTFRKLALRREKRPAQEPLAPPSSASPVPPQGPFASFAAEDPVTPIEQMPLPSSSSPMQPPASRSARPAPTAGLAHSAGAGVPASFASTGNTGNFPAPASQPRSTTGALAFLSPSADPSSPAPGATGAFPFPADAQGSTGAFKLINNQATPAATGATGQLMLTQPTNEQGGTGVTGTIKLTGPVKIIQVPVAGQPGQYVTGLLPVLPAAQPTGQLAAPPAQPEPSTGLRLNKRGKIVGLVLAILLVLSASGVFWFSRSHSGQNTPIAQNGVTVTPNIPATATARALATVDANIILSDPLNQNIHNWPVVTTGPITYTFKANAYHIANNDPTRGAPAILPDEVLTTPFSYSLTMQEVKGDDNSINNEFGMIVRASTQGKKTMFYAFEVLNTKKGVYQFWRYDSSQSGSNGPYKMLWSHSLGREFHQGHGPANTNTLKILANGKNFTLFVNGKQVGTVQDGSIPNGKIGMLVNLKGTEVAFSNLLLTHK